MLWRPEVESVAHESQLRSAGSGLKVFHNRFLWVAGYVLGLKMGVDKTIILVWTSPEFSELAFLHIVECDWILLGQVISNYVIHIIFNGFRRPVSVGFNGQWVSDDS